MIEHERSTTPVLCWVHVALSTTELSSTPVYMNPALSKSTADCQGVCENPADDCV